VKNPDTEFVKIRLEAEQSLRDGCEDNGIDFAVVYLPDIVYGNGGSFRSMFLQKIRTGRFRVPGTGDYVKPLIHLDDAVGFLIAILAKNAVRGSYIATDSVPVAFGEFVNFIADQLGVRHPPTVPAFLAEIAVGKDLIKMLTRSTAKISNEKMRRLYELRYPSYREGIVDVVRDFISQ
jgi:nucleoside-diphosphate-sugar epimerase